jgi:hypothetical protein
MYTTTVLRKVCRIYRKVMQCSVARTVTNIPMELIKRKIQRENHILPGATASTNAPTALPSFQSDVKFVIGRSGSLLWIQCSNLNTVQNIYFVGFKVLTVMIMKSSDS